ncbi:MAG: CinA family nicotinamide mononucleotide deamidase-related protein [Bacteroidales bacterium]|nr:CinA family nicotinamide mononucleotide deamidase-related protein [Bacteroidales bacterium]
MSYLCRMVKASICTIGDEILIGQIVDTNSSHISRKLGEIGIKVTRMVSIADNHEDIITSLSRELDSNDIVVSTGGLGPTKDDITKPALAELFHSKSWKTDPVQLEIVKEILHSRGLDVLDINLKQAEVPDCCEVIPNHHGTAPIMVFERSDGHRLYSLPGVPHEALGAIDDVINDIKHHFNTESIYHKTIMVYGFAESALSQLIAPWEDALPKDVHLAYLPNTATGIRLRLSVYGGEREKDAAKVEKLLVGLREILGDNIYSEDDEPLESVIGKLLRGTGKTLSAAESCTGGMISHLITTIPGSSEYYLGSVTSYAIAVKEKVLGVPSETIQANGVVSSEVAAAMAEGVRKLTGSTYSVATTGLAGPGGDDRNPEGTVWIGVSGPHGTLTRRYQYHNDRKRNIERFAASALDLLRRYILAD